MNRIFADVALNLPSKTIFQYSIPDALRERVVPGERVWVSVRTRRMMGTVTRLSEEASFENIRDIDDLPGNAPRLEDNFLKLTHWISEYYYCSWGQAIDAALPASFKKGKFTMKSRLAAEPHTIESVNPTDLALTPAQNAAYEKILEKIRSKQKATFLLHGITGSGKTEVYMHAIRELIKEGRGSIVLVPEISLTPQTMDRFYSRFGDCVAVIHSRLSQGKRVQEWHRIRSGEAKVVVGPRSAVFSPVKNLGLIIIDEEHDGSYKQNETPRYHAREVAAKRCELENAVLVLGGATPSLEAYHDAQNGKSIYLSLPERIEKRPLPVVEIVDMKRQREGKREAIFSELLQRGVQAVLAKKEQAILFLNRRGFSTYLHCPSCAYVMTCENCRISMAYHIDRSLLLCHVCHSKSAPPRLCPGCQKNYLHYFGIGTQKVEQEALKLFPGARIGRMDSDSTTKKNAHETILRAFKRHEIDILIGTQMIAKGHDFPNVSLIGVISADTALHIPDFRAAETTFSLLTQVAGRAGRGDVPGKVVVQTFVPHHYSIQSAQTHDYRAFYEKEIVFRRELSLPPLKKLMRIVLRGNSEKEVVRQSIVLKRLLETTIPDDSFQVLGPAPCLISKESGDFLWNLYFKGPDVWAMHRLLQEAFKNFQRSKVALTLDVDPQ